MSDDETSFPMDAYVADASTRPWNFNPVGYLVTILTDAQEAQRGQEALVQNGFAPEDVKLYSGKEILENYARYEEERSRSSKVVGAVADDREGRDLYVAYARDDRCAMWVRIPDEYKVAKAMRVLADFDKLYTRYYGEKTQYDFHIS